MLAKNHKKDDNRGSLVDNTSFICVLPDHPNHLFGEVNKTYWMHVPVGIDKVSINQYYEQIIPMYEEALLKDFYENDQTEEEY